MTGSGFFSGTSILDLNLQYFSSGFNIGTSIELSIDAKTNGGLMKPKTKIISKNLEYLKKYEYIQMFSKKNKMIMHSLRPKSNVNWI